MGNKEVLKQLEITRKLILTIKNKQLNFLEYVTGERIFGKATPLEQNRESKRNSKQYTQRVFVNGFTEQE